MTMDKFNVTITFKDGSQVTHDNCLAYHDVGGILVFLRDNDAFGYTASSIDRLWTVRIPTNDATKKEVPLCQPDQIGSC